MDRADLKAELEKALKLENETERKLAVVAVIREAVKDLGFDPVVVGGLAVEFWTHGAYTTGDIDLYLPHGPAVDDVLAELGFERTGRHWVLPEQRLLGGGTSELPGA